MSKYRIQYSQGGEVKFISHLDFLRTINRVFVRAKLPLKYSNGFNPHTIMTIGLPLSVGTTSQCDVLDIELTDAMDTNEMKDVLNENCPRGIKILNIKEAQDLKPLFNIDSAIYTAFFDSNIDLDLQSYIDKDSVMIEKKSKRGMNLVNIKDFIRSIEIIKSDNTKYGLRMHINAGNFSNLKPELVLSSIENYCGGQIFNISVNREKIFFDDGKEAF